MGALLCVCEAERVPASVPTGEGQCDKREECDKRRTRGVGRPCLQGLLEVECHWFIVLHFKSSKSELPLDLLRCIRQILH
jgi:hypothetical protein